MTSSLRPPATRNIYQAIEIALKAVEQDPHLANFMLRDRAEVKDAGLDDLVWAMHRDGNIHRNDVIFVIEHLEKHLSKGC